jgi:hypothetical protein
VGASTAQQGGQSQAREKPLPSKTGVSLLGDPDKQTCAKSKKVAEAGKAWFMFKCNWN